MRKPPPLPGCLVVVELGAEWPDEAVREAGLCPRRVVSQGEGESPEAFARRLGPLAGRLFPAGVALCRVVVACNERTDVAAFAARRALARRLLSGVTAREPELLFAASERAAGRLRHALSALATDLSTLAGARVSVRFGAEHAATPSSSVARVA